MPFVIYLNEEGKISTTVVFPILSRFQGFVEPPRGFAGFVQEGVSVNVHFPLSLNIHLRLGKDASLIGSQECRVCTRVFANSARRAQDPSPFQSLLERESHA